jgi:DHA2 family multidrug resistance protein-like MFS transporter
MGGAGESGDLRAGRREWVGLAVLALPTLLVTMDLSVLFLAVPALTKDLQPSSAELLWITDIYGFLIAGSLITMGALGDRIGRRRLLLIGGGAFAIGSLLAAFSTSAPMLIAARAVLGVAGGTLAPSSLSLIRTMFRDEQQRTTAIGVWISCFAGGAALGPLLGGALLEQFWWGSVFLLNVPVMALLLALGPRLLPESRDPAGGRIDVVSAVLSMIAVLAVIYGVKRIAEHGIGGVAAVSVLGGLAVGALFVARQQALTDPLIDLPLFRAPAFSAAVTANIVATFVVIGTELFTAQYLQLVLGMGPLEAGLWSLPSVAGIIVGSMLAPLLVRRARPAQVVAAGLVLAAVGLGLLTQVGASSGLALIVAGTAITGLGVGPVGTVGTDLIVGAAPPERAGAASGISETGTELGGALGIAVLGSIGAAVYRSEVADAASAGADARLARDTLGGAVEAAARLPGRAGDELLDAANAAFAQALQLAALIACAVAVCMAIVTLALLGRPPHRASARGELDVTPAGGPDE